MRLFIIIFLIIGNLSAYGTHPSVLPKGFKPKKISYISFRENKGQITDQNHKTRNDVLFSGHSDNFVFHLTNKGIIYQLHKRENLNQKESFANPHKRLLHQRQNNNSKISVHSVEIDWLNAFPNATIEKGNALPDHDSFYLTSCEGGVKVKSYKSVTYKELYKGIDLMYYEKNGHLKYDYQVAAGANYKQIELVIKGGEKISINSKGELVIKTTLGDIIEQAPMVYQQGKQLEAKWTLIGNVARFAIKGIDSLHPYTIDPLIRNWSTYYGGEGLEWGYSSAVDDSGNVYLSGSTNSSYNIASFGSWKSVREDEDLFLVKFNSKGERIWGTYYGGEGIEETGVCSVDDSGNVYLSGSTRSYHGIATPDGWQKDFGGKWDAFLVKFNSNGTRLWGTYYGESHTEFGSGCAVDDSGNVYLTGYDATMYGENPDSSNYFSTEGAYQRYNGGTGDAYLAKFNSNGMRVWGTYFGKWYYEFSSSCTVDQLGNVYIVGWTDDSKWHDSWEEDSTVLLYADAFLAKFSSKGQHLWSGYYDGGNVDVAYACTVDPSGNVYIVGDTESKWLIRNNNGWQKVNGGNTDGFIIKFNSKGERIWDTYYGGDDEDMAYWCTADIFGNLYVTGTTSSSKNIASSGSWQEDYLCCNTNEFIVKFDSNGVRQWGTYYTEGTIDFCLSDNFGNLYLSGHVDPDKSLPVDDNSWQTEPGGGTDAFLIKYSLDCDEDNNFVSFIASDTMVCAGNPVVLKGIGANLYKWNNKVVNGVPFYPTTTKSYIITGFDSNECWDTTQVTVIVNPNPSKPTITSSSNSVCDGSNELSANTGYASYQWYLNDIKLIGANTNTFTPLVDGNYTVKTGELNNDCKAESDPFNIQSSSTSNQLLIAAYGSPNDTLLSCTGALQYQWYADGRLIVGANSQNYRVRYNGEYSVDIITSNGCRIHSNVHKTEYPGYVSILKSGYMITDSTIVEMDNNDLSWIHIFPNPANELINIMRLSESNQSIRLELYNDQGEKVDEKIMPDQTTYLSFDISTLPSGLYLLNISNGRKEHKEKIIKY